MLQTMPPRQRTAQTQLFDYEDYDVSNAKMSLQHLKSLEQTPNESKHKATPPIMTAHIGRTDYVGNAQRLRISVPSLEIKLIAHRCDRDSDSKLGRREGASYRTHVTLNVHA